MWRRETFYRIYRISSGSPNLRRIAVCGRRYRSPHFPSATTTMSFHTSTRVSQPAAQGLLLEVLKAKVSSGHLQADQAQERVAKRLHRLQQALEGYTNEPLLEEYNKRRQQQEERRLKEEKKAGETNELSEDEGLASKRLKDVPAPETDEPPTPAIRVPRGLYVYGPVGTGKSMLMDTFFALAHVKKKRRYHFHSFLAHVHQRIHQMKQDDLKRYGRNFSVDTSETNNPIHRVGLQLANEVALLCFDEFQVNDIADALILSQLFSVLFAMGTVVVATSNRPPEALYEGGLNRSYFLPFIDLLKKHCIVHQIMSEIDYRHLLSDDSSDSMFFTARNPEERQWARERMENLVTRLLNGREMTEIQLDVGFQRSMTIHDADPEGLVACFDFDELCATELGALDYRAIAQHFTVIVMEDIPILTLQDHNRARRFITLVDELYEAKTALLCSAATDDPASLFVNAMIEIDAETTDDAVGIDEAVDHGHAVGALASVRELNFAFQRAASRLREMTSRRWWDNALAE